MVDREKDELLREVRQDVKDLHCKLDNFLERISAAEAFIRGHGTILMFIGTAILGIVGYLITGSM